MDITESLKHTENALRDFITSVLKAKYGDNWLDQSGISQDRIIKWKERKIEEEKRFENNAVEQRLLYYSDFYDLITLLQKNWNGELKQALGDWSTIKVFLDLLHDFRNPDAHRREFLPHQSHLILGITGEIRSRLVMYRSKKDTGDDIFPKIESVRDNLGNEWTPDVMISVRTGMKLRPGDVLEFIVTATDPLGEQLLYSVGDGEWQVSNILTLPIVEEHIQLRFLVNISIKSNREHHASKYWDDLACFSYVVLPNKK